MHKCEWNGEMKTLEGSEKRSVSSFNRARPTLCVMNGRGILKKKKQSYEIWKEKGKTYSNIQTISSAEGQLVYICKQCNVASLFSYSGILKMLQNLWFKKPFHVLSTNYKNPILNFNRNKFEIFPISKSLPGPSPMNKLDNIRGQVILMTRFPSKSYLSFAFGFAHFCGNKITYKM